MHVFNVISVGFFGALSIAATLPNTFSPNSLSLTPFDTKANTLLRQHAELSTTRRVSWRIPNSDLSLRVEYYPELPLPTTWSTAMIASIQAIALYRRIFGDVTLETDFDIDNLGVMFDFENFAQPPGPTFTYGKLWLCLSSVNKWMTEFNNPVFTSARVHEGPEIGAGSPIGLIIVSTDSGPRVAIDGKPTSLLAAPHLEAERVVTIPLIDADASLHVEYDTSKKLPDTWTKSMTLAIQLVEAIVKEQPEDTTVHAGSLLDDHAFVVNNLDVIIAASGLDKASTSRLTYGALHAALIAMEGFLKKQAYQSHVLILQGSDAKGEPIGRLVVWPHPISPSRSIS